MRFKQKLMSIVHEHDCEKQYDDEQFDALLNNPLVSFREAEHVECTDCAEDKLFEKLKNNKKINWKRN